MKSYSEIFLIFLCIVVIFSAGCTSQTAPSASTPAPTPTTSIPTTAITLSNQQITNVKTVVSILRETTKPSSNLFTGQLKILGRDMNYLPSTLMEGESESVSTYQYLNRQFMRKDTGIVAMKVQIILHPTNEDAGVVYERFKKLYSANNKISTHSLFVGENSWYIQSTGDSSFQGGMYYKNVRVWAAAFNNSGMEPTDLAKYLNSIVKEINSNIE
jgi:hypothetical protein